MTPFRFLLLLLLLVQALPAQTITASLEGLVRDATGAVVPNAQVRIVNTATNVALATSSDQDGRFLAPALPAGPYELTITAAGFKTAQRRGLVLEVNQAARLEIALEVGAVSETMNVTAEAPVLESSSSAVGQVIDNRNIVNLPLNQRNPFALVFLAPGVIGNVGFQFNAINFSANGGRPGSNDILLDGIPSSPPAVQGISVFTIFPSVDAVEEFRVQTNNYSAEFGRSGGAIVNLIYKSGGNQLRGSAFEFLRNSTLDANSFYNNRSGLPLTSFKRNQFGATVGGPVRIPRLYNGRNRTFFFADYEGLRQGSSTSILNTVPSAAQRTGDFSELRTAAGAPVVIYDPATTVRSGAGYVRSPFAANRIPAGRIDPVARNAIKYYPAPNLAGAPNSGTNNYAASGSGVTNIDQWDVKVDENLSDRHRFFVRFSRRNLQNPPPNLFPSDVRAAQGGLFQPQIGTGAAVDHTATLRPTFLLNLRYGFGRTLLAFRPYSLGFDPTTLGFPTYIRENADQIMFPGFNPANYLGIGNGAADYRRNSFETHSWTVSATKITGAHLFKFGYELRVFRVNNTEAGNASGVFNFDRNLTQGPDPNRASATAGDSVAGFLLGLGNGQLTRGWKGVSTLSRYNAWYFADDWKVSRALTLNLGLRYDLQIPRTERFNRMNYFDTQAASPLAGPAGLPDLKGGLVFVGVNGRSRAQFPTDYRNIAPRFGFALQAARRTVVRGAFGIFFAPSPTQAAGSVGNFGFRSDTPFVGSADGLTPFHYLSNPFPEGLVTLPGSSQGLSSQVGSAVQAPLNNTVTPYTENWNFGLQRELGGSVLVEASYVGSHGVKLTDGSEGDYTLNQLRPEALALGQQTLQQPVKNPFYGVITSGALSTPTVPYYYLLRPYPQFTGVGLLFPTGGHSTYHAFQLRTEKRFSRGTSFLLSYTSAKQIDDYSFIAQVGRNAPHQNIYDRKSDRAVSANDISQRMVLSAVYELPFGRNRRIGGGWSRGVDAVLGGWQLNGIATLQTGFALALTTQNTSNSGSQTLRPNSNGKSAKLDGSIHSRLDRFFDTSVFSQPAPYTFGNTGRTLPDVRGPGNRNLDFSLFKNFRIGERAGVQFRAEAFNLTNTVQFGLPNQGLNSPQFGVISNQANAPRQLQFGLKLLF